MRLKAKKRRVKNLFRARRRPAKLSDLTTYTANVWGADPTVAQGGVMHPMLTKHPHFSIPLESDRVVSCATELLTFAHSKHVEFGAAVPGHLGLKASSGKSGVGKSTMLRRWSDISDNSDNLLTSSVYLLYGTESGPQLVSKPMLNPQVEAVAHVIEGYLEDKKDELQEERISKLAEALALSDMPTPLDSLIETDNAHLRAEVYDNISVYLSDDIHRISGAKSDNKAAIANRWRGQGKIFGYKRGRTVLYPRFQFEDGKPRPIIQKILDILPESFGDWQRIFWFISPTGYLSDERPMDCLGEEERVLKAASKAGSVPLG